MTIPEPPHELDEQLQETVVPHLFAAYGPRYRQLLDLASGRPEWLQPVASGSPIIGAELVWAVREEQAITLTDAVLRRTPLGAVGFPGDDAAARAAAIVGDELGWPADRRTREIEEWRRFYSIP
jgi:glycerol-3-phosphate dehydrogenase